MIEVTKLEALLHRLTRFSMAAALAASGLTVGVPAAAQTTGADEPAGITFGQPQVNGDGSFEDAQEALELGRIEEAEAILRSLADEGHVDAQVALADLYYRGHGGRPRNYGEALELYERAAETGDIRAMLRLSFMYSYGVGTGRDNQRAELWERRAVDAGSATAMNNLAYTYAVEGRNLPEALSLIREAVTIEPQNGHFLDTLGWVLYRMGRYEEAIPPLCRSVQLLPLHPEGRIHLGDSYWRAGDVMSARYQWQLGLEIYGNPAARTDEDITGFLDSEFAEATRLALESRLSDGLSEAGKAPADAEDDKGVEARYLDECQIPTT